MADGVRITRTCWVLWFRQGESPFVELYRARWFVSCESERERRQRHRRYAGEFLILPAGRDPNRPEKIGRGRLLWPPAPDRRDDVLSVIGE